VKRIRHIWLYEKKTGAGTAVDLLGKIRKLSKMVARREEAGVPFESRWRRNSKSTS